MQCKINAQCVSLGKRSNLAIQESTPTQSVGFVKMQFTYTKPYPTEGAILVVLHMYKLYL